METERPSEFTQRCQRSLPLSGLYVVGSKGPCTVRDLASESANDWPEAMPGARRRARSAKKGLRIHIFILKQKLAKRVVRA